MLHPLAFPTGNDLFAGGGLKLPHTAHASVRGRALLYVFSTRPITPPPSDRGRGQNGKKTSQRKGREGKTKQE